MDIEIKRCPQHLRMKDGTRLLRLPDITENLEYDFGLELPHILQDTRRTLTAILPSHVNLEIGDTLVDEYGFKALVSEILERRKARGDWSANPFDKRPDCVKLTYL